MEVQEDDTPLQDLSNGVPNVDTPSTETSRKSKITRTVILYIGFVFLGMVFAIIGPTLLDLQHISNSSTEQIAFIITGRSVGILLGCLLSTVLIKFFDPWLSLGIGQVVLGVTSACLPWCYDVYIQVAVAFVMGVTVGQYDAGGNLCLLFIWKTENGPWMQALHLVFGLGAMLAPVIVEPFLLEKSDPHALEYSLNQTLTVSNATELPYVLNTTGIESSLNGANSQESRIAIPFGLVGVGEVLIGLVFLGVFIKDGLHVRARKDPTPKEESPHCEKALRRLKIMRIAIILLIFLFYTLYCTIESEMGNFLSLFCVNFLGWTKSRGALITAAFWTSFTISRGFGIFLVKCVRPQIIIFSDLIVAVCGIAPLLFFIEYHPAVMWVCAVIAGAGIATIYATGITWTEQYIKVTETVGSVFAIGGALSDMYGPILIVFLMEHVAYMSYVYLQFAILCILIVCMAVLQLMANQFLKWKEAALPIGQKKDESEEPINTMVSEVVG